ncbi:hypothetical protein RN001_000212 [Aquatica leii]|uniref:Lipoyl-binding domain-containing protein n=1 Tax=Aquatica leii TaxID=1421715 RepID=A0AAN7PLZ8_9COLE|nr:hypothetical protein RN001_000212 [Aquatica leii]
MESLLELIEKTYFDTEGLAHFRNRVKFRLYYNFCIEESLCQDVAYLQQQKLKIKLSHNIHTSTQLLTDITVKAPVFPDSIADGDVRWKKKQGDNVTADEVIAEIETDKVALPVPAPSTGVIRELLVKEGSQIKSEAIMCTIDVK